MVAPSAEIPAEIHAEIHAETLAEIHAENLLERIHVTGEREEDKYYISEKKIMYYNK